MKTFWGISSRCANCHIPENEWQVHIKALWNQE